MSKPRVFHGIVNYGTQSGYLAKGLRNLGYEAKSFTLPDKYKRDTDYSFKQRGTLLAKVFYYLIWYPLIRTSCIFKFDIFHFYYGTSLWSNHLDLPILKFLGKKVVHHYLGHDVEQYRLTKDKYEFSNMDFWADDKKGLRHDKIIKKRFDFENKYSDFQMVCAPQYSQFVPGSTFIPLAIDLSRYSTIEATVENFSKKPVTIVHAPTHRGVKGTQSLIDAVERLQAEGVSVTLNICEGITHAQLLEEYKKSDFSVTSLRGGWFGTAGIEAMASGKGIIAFLREEYYSYVDQDYLTDLPVVNGDINSIYQVLKEVIATKDLKAWGERSRIFVEKYHDMNMIAEKVSAIYESLE